VTRLDAELAGYETGTRQMAVALFPSLDGESLEDFSIRLAEQWKIGGKKQSDGVLLLAFLDEHKIRIEVGYGLEGQLTDAVSARIIRDVIAPHFRSGDFAGGLSAGAAAIDTTITGRAHEQGRLPEKAPQRHESGGAGGLVFLLFFVVIVALSAMRRRRGAYFGGGGFTIGGGGASSFGGGGGSSSFGGGGGSFGGGGASGGW
jgi:uncharacterized protein